jgi:hypothetical protein
MLGENLVEYLTAEARFLGERLNRLERKKLRRNARHWQEKKKEGIVRENTEIEFLKSILQQC